MSMNITPLQIVRQKHDVGTPFDKLESIKKSFKNNFQATANVSHDRLVNSNDNMYERYKDTFGNLIKRGKRIKRRFA